MPNLKGKFPEEIKSGKMELLSLQEVIREMKQFLEHVDSEDTVFRANHPSNYFNLRDTLNHDIPKLLEKLEQAEKYQSY